MTEIIGIQFKNTGRVYYFSPVGLKFEIGEEAIVETKRGLELGKVIIANRFVEDDEVEFELKNVIRKASKYDLMIDKKHQEMAPSSFEIFKKYVSELNLPMKPLYCEYTIDSSKIIFYYSAEDRVDFRELLKVLTPNFKTRVELMQIGPREAARIVGGIGNCGRVICCKSCLNSFDYVTMKMAKDQNMSLNTNKISGLCGKLMCCIAFEHQLYVEARKELPSVGEMVKTPTCACCKVQSVDYVKKIVMTEETLGATLVKHNAADVQKVVVGNPDVDEEGATLTATSDTEVVEEEVVVQVAQKDNEQKNDANKYHKKIYKPYKKYKKKASKETVNK